MVSARDNAEARRCVHARSSHSREGSQRASKYRARERERKRERYNKVFSLRARGACWMRRQGQTQGCCPSPLHEHGSRCNLWVLATTLLTPAGVAAQRQCALVPAGNHANNCGATTNGTQVTFRGVFACLCRVTLELMRGARLRLADLAAGSRRFGCNLSVAVR